VTPSRARARVTAADLKSQRLAAIKRAWSKRVRPRWTTRAGCRARPTRAWPGAASAASCARSSSPTPIASARHGLVPRRAIRNAFHAPSVPPSPGSAAVFCCAADA
jgi:hypothetical protein